MTTSPFAFVKNSLLLILLLLLSIGLEAANLKILTWNIRDLGKSKDDQEIKQIAQLIHAYDIIAIQEVVAKDPAGAQAVARIADQLNRMGNSWDYRVSDPTTSESPYQRERYAFIWKASVVQLLGRPQLDRELAEYCVREPYIGKFRLKGATKPFYLLNFHSKKYNDNPQEEIQYFGKYQQQLGTELVFLVGDFNLGEQHSVWKPFYQQGYKPSLTNTPTTLKRKCSNGQYFNHAIDNIYYDEDVVNLRQAGRIDFIQDCEKLELARGISDHVPVYLDCEIAN